MTRSPRRNRSSRRGSLTPRSADRPAAVEPGAETRVLLVSMPFGALDRQALGISLLKAQLERLGIGCDVRYLNFSFAEFVGYDDYRWMTYDIPHTAFAGEWCFQSSVSTSQRMTL